MKKGRVYLAIGCFLLIVLHLVNFDFDDITWEANRGSIIGIVSMLLAMASLYFTDRYTGRNKIK